ncbi:hypothetical protein CCMSSC00406_0002367 [Pleurotus cornucopiae]|uniref:Uncharacterized protein n=1 Tax=Pleurotus cornucopiae TaxID=5321 RepID=A0ACB7IS26_PLECO|nr:hypothetical protein CCMSSC00406_0002367 [Pleurotus cornucopiae]
MSSQDQGSHASTHSLQARISERPQFRQYPQRSSLPNLWLPPHSGPIPQRLMSIVPRDNLHQPATPPHLVTRFDLPDLPQEPPTTVATDKPLNGLSARHYQSEQGRYNAMPSPPLTPSSSIRTSGSIETSATSHHPTDFDTIKSFSQKHQAQGIVLLIFFDTRVASQARDLFSQPGTFSSDIVADATEALSCTLTSLEVILELTGYSDHLAYMQSAFHLHVSENGKSDDQLDNQNSSLTLASEQGGYDLSLVKRFLGSFGALRLFAPAQETSAAENAQDCSHFIVDYYDLRDAKSAFVSLDERVLYGMQLRVSGVDILPPPPSRLAPPPPNATSGLDTTTRVPFPAIDTSHRHTQSDIHEAGQSIQNRERLSMGLHGSTVRPRSLSVDTVESPLTTIPPTDTSLAASPGGTGPMYLYSSSTSIQVYAHPTEGQYPYPSPAPAAPFDIPTPFYAPANPVPSSHPYQHPQQFVFPYGNAFPQEGDVVRASDGTLHTVMRGSGSPMHVLIPFGPSNPVNTGERWSESPPSRRGSADRNTNQAQHQGRGMQARRHDGPTRTSTPAEIMGSHSAHSSSPQPQQHGHPSRSAPKNNALDIPTIEAGLDTRTTVMIRNIPNKMTNDDLIAYIDSVCPRRIDFLYLRMDFSNGCNVGYAFVNFIAVEDLMTFAKAKLGQKWNMFSSEKILEMSYADYQGKESQVEKFKNSSIMDEREEWRPKIFRSEPGPDQGLPEPFPAPTHLRRKQISSHNRAGLFPSNHSSQDSPSSRRGMRAFGHRGFHR